MLRSTFFVVINNTTNWSSNVVGDFRKCPFRILIKWLITISTGHSDKCCAQTLKLFNNDESKWAKPTTFAKVWSSASVWTYKGKNQQEDPPIWLFCSTYEKRAGIFNGHNTHTQACIGINKYTHTFQHNESLGSKSISLWHAPQ